MSQTKIEWADKVWNPITGCSPISDGCRNCYAHRMATRLKGRYGYPKDDPFKVTFHPDRLDEPLHWKKPSRIFVVSMGDLFHEEVKEGWVDQIFTVMALCLNHTFMVLSKRPKRMLRYCLDKQTPFRIAKGMDCISVSKIIMDSSNEDIRPIPNYPNYFISNFGNVYSGNGSGICLHCGKFVNGIATKKYCSKKCHDLAHYYRTRGKKSNHPQTLRLMSPDIGDQGHMRVMFYKDGKTFRELIYRLVLSIFVREPIENEQGCHRDGNPQNNHIANLRWGTQEDNWEDRIRHGKGQSWKSLNTSIPSPIEWPLSNCLIGVSVEDQKAADERIPILLQIPAAKRFLSCEPLLEKIDLISFLIPTLKYNPKKLELVNLVLVICGGETGPKARPLHPEWVRSLRDQCQATQVPFFFKSWGEWFPVGEKLAGEFKPIGKGDAPKRLHLWPDRELSMRTGRKAAGRLLDGKIWEETPCSKDFP